MVIKTATLLTALLLVGSACKSELVSSPTTSSNPPTTTAAPKARTPTARVVQFYDRLNGGDVDLMMEVWPTADRSFLELMAVGLHERTAVGCSPGDTADSVVCEEFVGNDFFDPARITSNFTVRYQITDDFIVGSEVVTVDPSVTAYDQAFGEWLRADDPGFYTSSFDAANERLPWKASADAEVIVAKVQAFIEASDTYPIASS